MSVLRKSGLFFSACVAVVFVFADMAKVDELENAVGFAHYCEMVESGAWPDYREQAQYCETTTTKGVDHARSN